MKCWLSLSCAFLVWCAVATVPATYEELLYLESSGTQYIDTGCVMANDNGLAITYQTIGRHDTGNAAVCGSRPNAGDSRCMVGSNLYLSQYGHFGYSYLYMGWNNILIQSYNHILDSERGTGTLNFMNDRRVRNRGYEATITSDLVTQTGNIYIFAASQYGDETPLFGKFRVYSFRYTKGYNLVMNLVPVRRVADGELGLYDVISEKFFTNKGTGTFVAGPLLSKCSYQDVAYLLSDYAHFIDTGICMTDEHGLKITYQNLSPDAGNINVCGSRLSNADTRCVVGANEGRTYLGWNKLLIHHDEQYTDSSSVCVSLNWNNSRVATFGEVSFTLNEKLVTQTASCYIGAAHYSYQEPIYGKCFFYDFGMTKGTETILKMRPVRRFSDNAPGMWDEIGKRFYPSVAKGDFGYGDDIDFPDDLVKLEYIESSGTQYINTGVKLTSDITLDVSIYNALAASKHFIGARKGYANDALGLSFQAETGCEGYRFCWGDGVMDNVYGGALTNGIGDAYHSFFIGNTSPKIDKTFGYSFKQRTFTTDLDIYAFTVNDNGKAHSQMPTMRMKSLKMWDGGNAVREYLPVYSITNNAIGLWDLVGKKFYGNLGTGAFKMGTAIDTKLTNVIATVDCEEMFLTNGESTNVTFRTTGGLYRLITRQRKTAKGNGDTLHLLVDGEEIKAYTPQLNNGSITENLDIKFKPGIHTFTFTPTITYAESVEDESKMLVKIDALYLLREIPCGSVIVIR